MSLHPYPYVFTGVMTHIFTYYVVIIKHFEQKKESSTRNVDNSLSKQAMKALNFTELRYIFFLLHYFFRKENDPHSVNN